MPISTIDQKGLTNPLTSLAANTVTSAAATALTLQSAGTTAVTINTSQNVGVGNTNPSDYKLVVDGEGSAGGFALKRTGTLTGSAAFRLVGSSGSEALGISVNGTEDMRIDVNGNVGIGTSSPAAVTGFTSGRTVLQVTNSSPGSAQLRLGGGSGTMLDHDNDGQTVTTLRNLYGATSASAQMQLQSGFLTFGTGTSFTERMRITSSGQLSVGATSAGASKVLLTNSNNVSGDQNTSLQLGANCNNTSSYYLICSTVGSGADRMYILGNGNLQNINNSYGALSDVKLKENIVDATPKLDKLNQVRVVTYNLKENPEQKLLGVVAQELEQIFPSMIEETPDRDAEGNVLDTTTKAVKYSVFVPMLIKAIQELKAEFDAYKASHP